VHVVVPFAPPRKKAAHEEQLDLGSDLGLNLTTANQVGWRLGRETLAARCMKKVVPSHRAAQLRRAEI
jgi:hypothetical protein